MADPGALIPQGGFEPPQADPESAVLPLHNRGAFDRQSYLIESLDPSSRGKRIAHGGLGSAGVEDFHLGLLHAVPAVDGDLEHEVYPVPVLERKSRSRRSAPFQNMAGHLCFPKSRVSLR